MGIVASWNRLRYYRRSLGAGQTAKLYGARALRRPEIALRVPGLAHPVSCRPTEPDRFTVCHVFAERDCDVPFELSVVPRLVVDAGANVGYASIFYAKRFPGARIVGLEPDLANLAVARRNCAPYPQIELLQAGLWPDDGLLRIVDPKAASWAFQMRAAAEDEGETVEGISMPTLLRRLGAERIDVLKLDIEGSEEPLFSSPGCRDWLPAVDVVLVEIHGDAAERAVAGAMNEASFVAVPGDRRNVYVNPRLGS